MSAQRMTEIRVAARGALGKGAGLRRSAPWELIAHGGPSGDPQVMADLKSPSPAPAPITRSKDSPSVRFISTM
eukprot:1702683-Amphidinium_carterae.1